MLLRSGHLHFRHPPYMCTSEIANAQIFRKRKASLRSPSMASQVTASSLKNVANQVTLRNFTGTHVGRVCSFPGFSKKFDLLTFFLKIVKKLANMF